MQKPVRINAEAGKDVMQLAESAESKGQAAFSLRFVEAAGLSARINLEGG